MANIDSLSPSLRDDLLKRNLILPNSVENNGLGGRAAGVGKQAVIGGNAPSVQQGEKQTKTFREAILGLNTYDNQEEEEIRINLKNPENHGNIKGNSGKGYNGPSEDDDTNIEQIGDEERDDITAMNPYKPDSDYRRVDIGNHNIENLGNLGKTERPKSYSGPDMDIRGMMASRTLTPNVQDDDTLIGRLSDDYRQENLLANFEANLEQETVGRIDTRPFSVLRGNDLIIPNYTITTPKGELGKAADFGSRVLGFEVPVSLMATSSSIFYSENPISNIERANSMLDNSGEGQVVALINNMNQNKYKPGYEDDRVDQGLIQGDKGLNPELYAFGTSDGKVINLLNTNENDRISHSYDTEFNQDFDDLINVNEEFGNNSKFTWTDDNNNNAFFDTNIVPPNRFSNQNSILSKTRGLFTTNRMKTLVSGKGMQTQDDEVSTPTRVELGGDNFISKGSAIQSGAALRGEARQPHNVFCRAWTTFDQYSQVGDLQKHEGLNKEAGFERSDSALGNTVLDDNGFVRIAPRKNQDEVKDYMLSIENLAWSDNYSKLPPHERGPGDPITGTKGRIMWFPPYDIQITDNSTASWDSTEFIGRGEPVYTYNNTERNMTLGFKVIIDYPSYLEQIKGDASPNFDSKYISTFAGCHDLSEFPKQLLSSEEQQEVKKDQKETKDQSAEDDKTIGGRLQFSVYFANDQEGLPPLDYEDGDDSTGDGFTQDGGNVSENKQITPDRADFGLNEDWFDISQNRIDELKQYFSEGDCSTCKVKIKGFASSQGNDIDRGANEQLARDRAEILMDWFVFNVFDESEENLTPNRVQGELESDIVPVDENAEADSIQAKIARAASAEYEHDPSLSEEVDGAKREKAESDEDQETKKVPSQSMLRRLTTEKDFFEKMSEEEPFIYNSIRDKIRYFHPSFHSTTPEGFNSRLTFLHQCMRQGPTQSSGEGDSRRPNNLAFGRPPVCILRVGDFYYTKIVIDNLNIDFEPLVWDLNPEGVGVQPMIANVHLSFKAVGGSSLKGPINMLQNAVSFNFFANTHMYDPRSHRITNNDNVETEEEYEDIADDTQKPSEQDGIGNNSDSEDNQEAGNENENTGQEEEEVSDAEETLMDKKNVRVIHNGSEIEMSFNIKSESISLESPLSVEVWFFPVIQGPSPENTEPRQKLGVVTLTENNVDGKTLKRNFGLDIDQKSNEFSEEKNTSIGTDQFDIEFRTDDLKTPKTVDVF